MTAILPLLPILAGALPGSLEAADRIDRPVFYSSLDAATEAAATDQAALLILFGAEGSEPCRALKRTTLRAKEFLEQSGPVRVAEIDIDSEPKLARRFGVKEVPTLVLMSADGKVLSRRAGFVEAASLAAWLEEGRALAASGLWEGTATSGQAASAVKKAAQTEGLSQEDWSRLTAWLGDPDPARRAEAMSVVRAQGAGAIDPLIAAVADSYLGVRIGASEALRRLDPDLIEVDPWQSPSELSNTVVALKAWWEQRGALPESISPAPLVPTLAGAIHTAIESVRSEDRVRRTQAMSVLANQGPAALPAIRAAIERFERLDPAAMMFLEDVRWVILVGGPVEDQAGGVRRVLARGTSSQRQLAATRLGVCGSGAIPALAELVSDSDPLVAECAVLALSRAGAKEALPVMAALLRAQDGNLRMMAARALGQTKLPEATPYLLPSMSDSNEVVACTAIAALEEANARANQDPLSPEPVAAEAEPALRQALKDSRWRVRAAAVEAVGKLGMKAMASEARALLNDEDGFVIKNTLVALAALEAVPPGPDLAALAMKVPHLQRDIAAMVATKADEATVQAMLDLYEAATGSERQTILDGLALRDRYDASPVPSVWEPLLTRALSESNAPLRLASANLIARSPAAVAADMIESMLADDDSAVRSAAGAIVLGILSGNHEAALPSGLAGAETATDDMELRSLAYGASSRVKEDDQEVIATPARLETWHARLSDLRDANTNMVLAAARYATGDSKSDWPQFLAVFRQSHISERRRLAGLPALKVLMPKLSWPEAEDWLKELTLSPLLYVLAARESPRAIPEVGSFLLDPSRFRAVLNAIPQSDLARALAELVASPRTGPGQGWTLLAPDESTLTLLRALLETEHPAWRAAGVYALATRDAQTHRPFMEQALSDPNPWVRLAGVQGIMIGTESRAYLEQWLGPMVGDTNDHVAATSAAALLEPAVRAQAGLGYELTLFRYEGTTAGSSWRDEAVEGEALRVVRGSPSFLDLARRRDAEDPISVLLLAQYGQFGALDRLLAKHRHAGLPGQQEVAPLALTGIALSRDPTYVPFLRSIAQGTSDEWDLRRILQAARGMTGPEARALRLELNRRMRKLEPG